MHDDLPPPGHRELLGRAHPFHLLTPDVVDALFERMRLRRLSDGRALVEQGASGSGLFVVADGEVQVVLDDDGERREVARPSSGAVIGEMSLLTREAHMADVVAVGEVETLFLSTEDFEEIAREHPEVVVVLTEILAERLGSGALDSLGGKAVGDYRIVRCIGRGGMATVYEAVRVSDGERVALKMMDHRLVYHAGARARFHREADTLLSIEHDGVTRLHERVDAYRTSFLALEYCDGPSLAELVEREGAQGEEEVRALLGQLASALGHLHERRVLHRDLKPANVLLTTAGAAKLTDFGLAKPDSNASSTSLTREGVVIGTPRYMAPELFQGGPPGPASDVYSLGCVGYELLLGRPPFRARDFSSLVDEKERWAPPDRASFGRPVSAELLDLLESWTRRDPAERSIDLARCAAWAAPFERVRH